MRLVQVLLDDEALVCLAIRLLDRVEDLVETPREENAFALGERVRLHDVSDLFILIEVELVTELLDLSWDDPSGRKEVVLKRKLSSHAHQIPCKVVLSRDNIHPWIVVDLLMGVHL